MSVDPPPLLTISELKSDAPANPGRYRLRVQVAKSLQKSAKTGTTYLEWQIADNGGAQTVRVFGDAAIYRTASDVPQGSFVEIDGHWSHHENFGLEVKEWSFRQLKEAELDELLNGSGPLAIKQGQDFVQIKETISGISDPRLRCLCDAFLKIHGERFRRAGAARFNHHARRGGLVEHVAQMMRTAVAICDAYPALNRDLIVAGVLFHDSGKLWENCYAKNGFSMPFHEAGELMGHINLGIELVNRLWADLLDKEISRDWQKLEPESNSVRLHLLHLIASHHGEHAFGAPVLPKTPEAMVLHHVDNIDAKLEMMFEGYKTAVQLAPRIFDRVRPLPTNMIQPLGKFIEPTPLFDQDKTDSSESE